MTMKLSTTRLSLSSILYIVITFNESYAFNSPLFVADVSTVRPVPSPAKTKTGIEIELPDFNELFGRIEKVSPLAHLAMQNRNGGFSALDSNANASAPKNELKWKTVAAKPKNIIHKIEKIDNFQNLKCPLLRFRASLNGELSASAFADFITTIHHRKRWDVQIDNVQELYPVLDLNEINEGQLINNDKYGICTKLGVGYCQTKKNFVIDSREQLTMCGIQRFPKTGAAIIWGTEMEDRHNYLFPKDSERHTRARSHLFCAALVPTDIDNNSFDVEYVLQLDSGGNLPTFLTTPVVIEAVKATFKYAKEFYGGGYDGEIYSYDDILDNTNSKVLLQ